AAELLAYNHRVLGTWPLALTAYNHGTAGVRRAKETLGTDDIARIVRSYSSRTFGFASRNFYVSFLAALDIDRNPEKYFGALQKQTEARFQEVQVPAYVPMATLERALKIDADKLRALNPALLRSVWDGQQRVPKAYHLRLPLDGSGWTRELLAQRLSPAEMFAGQSSPPRYRVQRGDTLTSVAVRYGVSAETLARLNHLRTGAQLHAGRSITVPETAPVTVAAAAAPAPAAEAEQNPDPNDYSVAHDDTIRVAGDETLGHYADWLGVSTQHVRELNRFKFHRAVLIGQRIKLDFRKVSREAFEANRREYHRQLQAAYFA